MRRWTFELLMMGLALLSAGCLHLSRTGTTPFEYEPISVRHGETVPRSVGFNILIDNRPRGDRVRTRNIENVPEKVTAKLAEDLQKLQIFKAVHFPATEKDDVIITGTIKRFSWKAYENPLWNIPLVDVLKITGMPLGLASGVVDIRLQVKDGKTGASLGTAKALSRMRSVFNLYDLKPDGSGLELGESFRSAEDQLSEQVVSKFR